ncbi:D-methionine transport system substrate-binding protein [Fontibacillus phaseoli]|uniref:D-methionine transport system substrate-binding protein n=1 Tax=Fontibacillus phaseoli TaxID=1416533 RepID=A0A369BAP1_9BACL|nr:MetQ/NlpA family ABC transporter substrate-binding protein [Fontibacillus phaseoli]RCX18592.1 D-methionine transport system substrate-binding protein [Fontibacillus phaseoli]
MKKSTTVILLVAVMILSTVLAGCSGNNAKNVAASSSNEASSGQESNKPDNKKIVIGLLAREEPDVQYVAEKLKAEGYDIETRVFSDNIALNTATEDGSLDANYFQNKPYLKSFNESKNTHLAAYGPEIFTTPVLFVSKKYKSIDELPDGAKVGIANDSANRARELQLLEANGLIKLKEGVDLPTLLDIEENPKNLNFVETDPRNRVGIFPDLDAMTAPSITVYQMNDPEVVTLFEETKEVYSNYGGIIFVVKEGYENTEWLDKAIALMTSQEYGDWLLETYHGVKKPLN